MNRIGVLHTGSLGDTMVALPAMWRIREAYPNACICLITDDGVKGTALDPAQLLGPTGIFSEFLYYKSSTTLTSATRTLQMVRSRKFDSVFYLIRERTSKQLIRDKLFFKIAGISSIFGIENAYTQERYKPDMQPVASMATRLLKRVDSSLFNPSSAIAQTRLRTDLGLTTSERAEALATLQTAAGTSDTQVRFIAVAMGSKMPAKLWPLERYKKVLTALTKDSQILPVFIGSPKDFEAAQSVLTDIHRGINLCGESTLRQTAAFLTCCEICLAVDSGQMHIAAGEGIPCVALFSARNLPGLWHPIGDQHIVIRHELACGGCELQVCTEKRMECMNRISVEEVIDSCTKLLYSNKTLATGK